MDTEKGGHNVAPLFILRFWMIPTEKILIVGCGYVGTALMERLTAQGHEVWGLRRSHFDVPTGAHSLAADLADASLLDAAFPEFVDVIVFAAAAKSFDAGKYRATYVDGLKNVADAFSDGRREPPRLMLFVSSTGVYGQDDGSAVDETSATEPNGFSGQIMLEAESSLTTFPWASAAVRFGGIYGPGRTSMLRRVFEGNALTNPEQMTNRIHRDDCAGMLHHLIYHSREHVLETCYIGVDDRPAPQLEVVSWLAKKLEVELPTPAPAASQGHRHGGNKRCSNARIKATGYEFLYPGFEEGYSALIDAGEW